MPHAMTILSRYVFAELLKIFLLSLFALTAVMLLIGMVREGSDHGLTFAQIAQLFPFVLPDALRCTVPATILFAVVVVYGRMSGMNEIVALKAMGISPMVVLWPAFILAFLLSLATAWLNDVAVSWGRAGIQSLVIESLEDIAYSMLRTEKAFNQKQFSILVKRVEGRKLIQPTITIQQSGESAPITLTAAEAEIHSDTDKMELTFVCRNGECRLGPDAGYSFIDEERFPFPLGEAAGGGSVMPSGMALRIIPDEIAKQEAKIDLFDRDRAAKAAFQMITGDMAGLTSEEWRTNESLENAYAEHLSRLETEPHRRWSGGFACLCFALVGAPVAIWRRNADYMTSFGACFLPILALYYPLLMMSVSQAKHGTLPGSSVWLGNIVVTIVGLAVLRHVLRY